MCKVLRSSEEEQVNGAEEWIPNDLHPGGEKVQANLISFPAEKLLIST